MSNDNLYFRQLLAGRDFARNNLIAEQMANFCYLIGDRSTRKTIVVDPAWDVKDLVDAAEKDGMELVGASPPTTIPTTLAVTSSVTISRDWHGSSS